MVLQLTTTRHYRSRPLPVRRRALRQVLAETQLAMVKRRIEDEAVKGLSQPGRTNRLVQLRITHHARSTIWFRKLPMFIECSRTKKKK